MEGKAVERERSLRGNEPKGFGSEDFVFLSESIPEVPFPPIGFAWQTCLHGRPIARAKWLDRQSGLYRKLSGHKKSVSGE